jgi:CMP-N-acetylneuraminic acid synthetase
VERIFKEEVRVLFMGFKGNKVVGMIPARVDSSRVPKKNLRYLGDKPLIEHIIDTVKQVDFFDGIYINSPDVIFKGIAEDKGISFFNRPVWNNSSIETNDDFTYVFLKNIECDICLLCNPTSPLLSVDDFYGFIDYMVGNSLDTVLSVSEIKTFCVYKGSYINCRQDVKMIPTEDVTPVEMLVNSIMGWGRNSFLSRMDKHGCASLGIGGSVGYYPLSGDGILDIDWEDDFKQAEKLLGVNSHVKRYYEDGD